MNPLQSKQWELALCTNRYVTDVIPSLASGQSARREEAVSLAGIMEGRIRFRRRNDSARVPERIGSSV